MAPRATLLSLAADLAAGRVSSRALIEDALARVADPAGEGRRAFVAINPDAVRTAADQADRTRAAGRAPSPFAGIPVAIKDLFDVAGEKTRAGSRALDDRPPAAADAPAVARLRAAGFIPFGRTNMTEFAYSGLGMNAHFGTPLNPHDRRTGRIPGGSTSGGAVAVADGMTPAALGTDTGGSCRIPAALCGITGFKSTAARIPREGVIPLSSTLDSIGPLANSVSCCAILDAVLAGGSPEAAESRPIEGLKLAVPKTYVMDGLDDAVAGTFERAVKILSAAGAQVVDAPFAELAEIPAINSKGGIVNAEAYARHRPILEKHADRYDPWVLSRFDVGKAMSAADYIATLAVRAELIRRVNVLTAPFDAVILPACAIVAPAIADLRDRDVSQRTNLLLLRNTAAGNFLDRCALSIPCQAPGEAPVGLMVMGKTNGDRRLLSVGMAVEAVLRKAISP
ncbi:MAG: amidase [Alphaproteobacteria bacterium]|nr:amidase [Alphaproteobacteria bacterium]